jgi:hypothetical protein
MVRSAIKINGRRRTALLEKAMQTFGTFSQVVGKKHDQNGKFNNYLNN